MAQVGLVSVSVLLAQQDTGGGEPWWKYASIPVVAGVIGWGTNWLALKMVFWPVDFRGIRPPFLGWQGIVPQQARKMASIAMDNSMSKVGSLSDVIEEMRPEEVAKHALAVLSPSVPAMVTELAEREFPDLWARTPEPVRDAVFQRCTALLPGAVDRLKDDLVANADGLIDMRMMVIDQLSSDRRLLNRIFLEGAAKEFRFLVNSGFIFGLLLGLVQMGVMIGIDAFWVLPVFGVAVGYATNWLALKIIFEPVQPRRIGPFTAHALFLRRQDEVSAFFAEVTTRELLTIKAFVDRMLTGPQRDRTYNLVLSHIRPLVDEALGIARPAVMLAAGADRIDRIQADLAADALSMTMEPFDDPAFSESRRVLIEKLMYDRMVAMTPDEFNELLKPIVEADAWKLIAVGAVLGGLAGLAQAALVFAG